MIRINNTATNSSSLPSLPLPASVDYGEYVSELDANHKLAFEDFWLDRSKYPPAKPGALRLGPPGAADGVANAAPKTGAT